MVIPKAAGIVLFLFVIALGAYLFIGQYSAKLAVREQLLQARADSTLLANRNNDLVLQAAKDKAADEAAHRKALEDDARRLELDKQTALVIGALSRPQQENSALEYLAKNGFLDRSHYADATVAPITYDSSYYRAVATQGKVLDDTRQQLSETNTVVRKIGEQVTGLQLILNEKDRGITNTQMYVSDAIDERGLFRGRSKDQFKEVRRQLNEVQKIGSKPIP